MRESYNRTCRFLAYAAAALTALLSFLVVFDLAAHTYLLFEIWPDFVPTFFNTGLLYFLFGIALIYYLQGFKVLPFIIFFLVPVIPTLVLIPYETGWDFGVDQLFYLMPMTEYTEFAGRISPITAAALLASCLAMLSQYFNLKKKPHPLFYRLIVFVWLPDLFRTGDHPSRVHKYRSPNDNYYHALIAFGDIFKRIPSEQKRAVADERTCFGVRPLDPAQYQGDLFHR